MRFARCPPPPHSRGTPGGSVTFGGQRSLSKGGAERRGIEDG